MAKHTQARQPCQPLISAGWLAVPISWIDSFRSRRPAWRARVRAVKVATTKLADGLSSSIEKQPQGAQHVGRQQLNWMPRKRGLYGHQMAPSMYYCTSTRMSQLARALHLQALGGLEASMHAQAENLHHHRMSWASLVLAGCCPSDATQRCNKELISHPAPAVAAIPSSPASALLRPVAHYAHQGLQVVRLQRSPAGGDDCTLGGPHPQLCRPLDHLVDLPQRLQQLRLVGAAPQLVRDQVPVVAASRLWWRPLRAAGGLPIGALQAPVPLPAAPCSTSACSAARLHSPSSALVPTCSRPAAGGRSAAWRPCPLSAGRPPPAPPAPWLCRWRLPRRPPCAGAASLPPPPAAAPPQRTRRLPGSLLSPAAPAVRRKGRGVRG
jgi:hypothetical protein